MTNMTDREKALDLTTMILEIKNHGLFPLACHEIIETALAEKSEEISKLKAESHQMNEELIFAGERERELQDQLSTLRKELEEAKKCPWCGSTDLVCGKGHIEATDELKRQIQNQSKTIEVMREALELIGSLPKTFDSADSGFEAVRIAKEALLKVEEKE